MRWMVAAALGAAMTPGMAQAGWRGAEWGMTPEQVAANGLQSVSLTPSGVKACQTLARTVLAERGEPVRISDQIILKLIIWHDAKAANRIRLLLLGNSGCTLYYERLSGYEAIDKAAR